MKRETAFLVFLAVALIQLGVPASMILRHESTLHRGVLCKFHTQPVDPADVFRGRFVALRMDPTEWSVPEDGLFQANQSVFVTLGTDDRGFARIEQVSAQKPAAGDYVSAKVQYAYNRKVTLKWPFDRFYMDEKAAPAAETAYREHSRSTNRTAYVAIRVQDGAGIIEDLYIDDQPIRQFLKKQNRD